MRAQPALKHVHQFSSRIIAPIDAAVQFLYDLSQAQLADFTKIVPPEVPDGWQLKESNYTSSEALEPGRKLYCYEKKDTDGRLYEVRLDIDFDIRTVVVHGNSTDVAQGLMGSDGQAVYKQFGQDAYDFVKVDDLIDRGQLLFDVISKMFNEDSRFNPYQFMPFHKILSNYRDKMMAEIRSLRFDASQISMIRYQSGSFDGTVKSAEALIQQIIADLSFLYAETLKENLNVSTHESQESIAERMMQMEIDLIIERGRPFAVKTGEIDGNIMVSAQMPLGSQTLPSSDRSGKHDVKLSNHVRDFTGVMNPDGRIERRLAIDGHSSYPPIAEKDPAKRREGAYQAALEKVAQLVRDKMQAGTAEDGTETHPITVSYSAMLLLTPMRLNKTEKRLRKHESENRQLEDTAYALNRLRDESPIKLMIDGKAVFVEADVSFMNLATNVHGKMIQMSDSEKQKTVNARGMLEFTRLMQSRVPDVDSSEQFSHNINSLLSDIRAYYPSFLDSEIEERLRYINQSIKNPYADHPYLEQERTRLYLQLGDLQSSSYNQADNSRLQVRILDILQARQSDISHDAREVLLTQLRFLRAQDFYFNRSKYPPEMAYQFHVNYLLANASTGRDIEAFCKSGEDRTGYLRVSLLADIAFQEKYGYPPDLFNPNEKEKYHAIFAAKALELSASLENTKYNSEARSLQVNARYTNPVYNMKSGKAVAELAKKVYKKLSLTPSSEMTTQYSRKIRGRQQPSRSHSMFTQSHLDKFKQKRLGRKKGQDDEVAVTKSSNYHENK